MAKCFSIIWKFTLLVSHVFASFHHPRAPKCDYKDEFRNFSVFSKWKKTEKMFRKSFVSLRIFMVGCVIEWTCVSAPCTLYLCSYLFESIYVLRLRYKTTSAGEPHTQTITIVFILWFDVSWHDRLKHWKLATGNCTKQNFWVFLLFSKKSIPQKCYSVMWQSFNGMQHTTLA